MSAAQLSLTPLHNYILQINDRGRQFPRLRRGVDVLQAKTQDNVMVNTHISISRVFTALTRLDSGVETN